MRNGNTHFFEILSAELRRTSGVLRQMSMFETAQMGP